MIVETPIYRKIKGFRPLPLQVVRSRREGRLRSVELGFKSPTPTV
jgi:hypothetical protein